VFSVFNFANPIIFYSRYTFRESWCAFPVGGNHRTTSGRST